MKQFKWPRPPLILGVVLGDTIERYCSSRSSATA